MEGLCGKRGVYFKSAGSGYTRCYTRAPDMQCTLYIPHLIPPREIGDALWRTVDAPQLKTLLARAAFNSQDAIGADAVLCRSFGIAQQQDWPLAPLLARSAKLAADGGYWLCATPSHLQTRRNALVLANTTSLAVTSNESATLAHMLADHLKAEGVTLHAPDPAQWFLQCDKPPAITTTSLDIATDRDVRPFLPMGAESARWHRILTEIQMLLHNHAVNDAREAQGQLPLNNVWLWGGGTLPASVAAAFDSVWSDNASVRALAQHTHCGVQSQTARFTPQTLNPESHFFSLELLTAPIRMGDAQSWSTAVTALNRDWFNPLLEALKSRQLARLTLLSNNDTGAQEFVIQPGDLLKFWHKNKYLQ